jgi:hypothetical protein
MIEPLIYIPGFYTPENTLALYSACAKLNYPIRYSEPWGKGTSRTSVNLARFRPSQQKSAQLHSRRAVYSQL